jgi:hypothetical protein
MELVTVKIKGLVNTSRYGALSTGDLLRTDPEFAKHLVEECGAGEYVTGKAAEPEKPKRGRPAKQPATPPLDAPAAEQVQTSAPAADNPAPAAVE